MVCYNHMHICSAYVILLFGHRVYFTNDNERAEINSADTTYIQCVII